MRGADTVNTRTNQPIENIQEQQSEPEVIASKTVVTKSGTKLHINLHNGNLMDKTRSKCYDLLQEYYCRREAES